MQIPFLTSIWRSLAADVNDLRAVWNATKPLYMSGQVDASLGILQNEAVFPIPDPLVEGQLACVGVSSDELLTIREIVEVYNRSNGLNLLALTALCVTSSDTVIEYPIPSIPVPKSDLPTVLTQADMSPKTWALTQHINQFGLTPEEPGLATLWRHLAYWPGLLALIHAGFAPLQRVGSIQRAITHLLDVSRSEGNRLAHLRPDDLILPQTGHSMIKNYVFNPGLVMRMVCIGGGLATWLQPHDK